MGEKKGVFYPNHPQSAYPYYYNYPASPGGYGYPPVGYPHAGYHPPPHSGPPAPYSGSLAPPCYPGHGHGLGAFLAGGAAVVAAGYGAHCRHHHGYGSHGYGYYGHHHHHGKFKHYKFKRAKFGKRWKHGGLYGKHKFWK